MLFREKGPARIYSIATQKNMQGKGLGQRLLNFAYEEACKRHYHNIILEVRKTDRDTIRFYESAGFFKTKDLPGYYEDGADGIKMQKIVEVT